MSPSEPLISHSRKLLVIIAEAIVEKSLIKDIRQFGAQGYTVSEVHGGGLHGEREGAWEADRSIEIKVICNESIAEQIAKHVLEKYAAHYAMTMFMSEVGIFRAHKF